MARDRDIYYFYAKCRRVVSFTSRLLYSRERYLQWLGESLAGAQRSTGPGNEIYISCPCPTSSNNQWITSTSRN